MNAKKQNGLSPVVKDFLSIMLIIAPGVVLLLTWTGVMWLFLKHPDSNSRNLQAIQPQASLSPSSSSIPQTTPPQIFTPTNPQAAQPQASFSPSLEDLKNLQSKVEELRISNSSLKTQLDEMKTADSRVSDLVLASLGSLVAVAVIIPAVNAISQALSNRDERNKIQDRIKAELQKELAEQLGQIKTYLLLNDYEISDISINQAISGIYLKDIKDQTGTPLNLDELFANPDINDSEMKDKIRQIPHTKLRELKIHQYPLILQNISKFLKLQKYLYSLDLLSLDNLERLVEGHLKMFLSLLVLMTYSNEHPDKYILPRLSTAQLKEFKATFEDLNKYFDKNRPKTECSKVIKQIGKILLSNDLEQKFYFYSN